MKTIASRIAAAVATKPHPFQVEGVEFATRNHGRAIIGDSMGLGKTFQALAYLAINPHLRPAVVICPATVKWNWERELRNHAGLECTVLDGFKPFGTICDVWEETRGVGPHRTATRWFSTRNKRHLWLKDNAKRITLLRKLTRTFPTMGEIVVINYDVLEDWHEQIKASKPLIIIGDEVQKLKNRKAKRTQITYDLVKGCPKFLALSGTPIENGPIEFFPVLNMVAPKVFPNWHAYAFRYCGPKMGFKGHWKFTGASNVRELHDKIKPYMIRRMKSEVLKELPLKVRTVIPIEIDMTEYDEAEERFLNWLGANKGADAVKRARSAEAIVKMGELRRLAARAKMDVVHAWIKEWREETQEKLVLFGVHRQILTPAMAPYKDAMLIDGSTQAKDRMHIVDKFQNDPKHWLLFGNILAAGVGLTLHKASTVGFLELAWNPAHHEQAEDRVNRIGQTAKHINAYYFVAKGTIEEDMMDIIEGKSDIVGQVLDGTKAQKFEANVMDYVVSKLLKKATT